MNIEPLPPVPESSSDRNKRNVLVVETMGNIGYTVSSSPVISRYMHGVLEDILPHSESHGTPSSDRWWSKICDASIYGISALGVDMHHNTAVHGYAWSPNCPGHRDALPFVSFDIDCPDSALSEGVISDVILWTRDCFHGQREEDARIVWKTTEENTEYADPMPSIYRQRLNVQWEAEEMPNPDLIIQFMNHACRDLRMVSKMFPEVRSYSGNAPEGSPAEKLFAWTHWDTSGMVTIVTKNESRIQICANIYTCKPFKEEAAIAVVERNFPKHHGMTYHSF